MNREKDVWVLLEEESHQIQPYSLALIEEARRFVRRFEGRLTGIFFGPWIDGMDRLVGRYGVDDLCWFADDALRAYIPEVYKELLTQRAKEKAPLLIMATATAMGSDLMPRLSAKLKAPLVTHCTEINMGNDIEFIKPVQNGRLHATTISKSDGIRMVTMNPADLTYTKETPEGAAARVIELKPEFQKDKILIRQTGYLKADHRTIDIGEAEYIVAVGRGLDSKENLSMIEELADHIGAAIGGTRPMVDANVLPFERQIGQTGKRVSPRLVFLCGISGATEFMRGIEDAGTKLAINIDDQAPIFRSVDLGLVGDICEVIPRIIHKVAQRRSLESEGKMD